MDNRPIGIFDSGVGGLTVASQVIKQLENEEIVYFGDTARVPYGNKSKEIITKFSCQDVRFLLSKNVKAVIIACNTASANSLDDLINKFDVPVFGVVVPGAKEAVRVTQNQKVGIIATIGTVRSDAYKKAINIVNANVQVYSKACPLFVPLAEEGWANEEITRLTAEKYLKELIEKGVDTVVMGCTHYPLLRQCLQSVVGNEVRLVDPAYETAMAIKEYLVKNNMLRVAETKPQHSFFVSDTTDMFEKICSKALEKRYSTEEIDIESY
ncbi:MAG TPA: glutamate racemase [Lachnospiraceae bacterium]|nr:glutamate racemase [Lachnospiraceae bacterium]